jgi:NitT/TauT family transport system substrate-binding protein
LIRRALSAVAATVAAGWMIVSVVIVIAAYVSTTDHSSGSGTSSSAAADTKSTAAGEVRLGYFANVTHATALVGVAHGDFAKALGSTKLTTQTYNAGPAEMTALLGGQLDAAYVGPSSALAAFAQSHGQALRIVAGATSGGAELVVRPGITSVADLKGKTLATPQKGNTQDVALRAWLKQNGLTANPDGTGEVSVDPQDNAATLDQFKAGHIDGAWLPEPWASRMVTEAGAKVLVGGLPHRAPGHRQGPDRRADRGQPVDHREPGPGPAAGQRPAQAAHRQGPVRRGDPARLQRAVGDRRPAGRLVADLDGPRRGHRPAQED